MINGPDGGVLTFLSDDELCRIHEATLEILQQVGIVTDSDLILSTFAAAGAEVDASDRRIRISPDFIEAALDTTPGSIVLHGRKPERDLQVKDRCTYFGLGGSPTPHFRELGTGNILTPAKQDVINSTVLGDALENIDFVMSLAGAYDCAPEMHYLHEYDALLRHTSKPIIYSAPNARYAARFLEMAAAVAGGDAELRKRPMVTLFAESISPLCLSSYSEGMAEFAKAGAPILFAPSPIMGATSPVTLSGNLVIGNAETLAGICFAQILQAGTPVIYGPHTPVMDMRTARSTYAATEQAVARAAVAQLARLYGVPSFGTGGGTDAKCPDAQAGAEVSMNVFLNALAGINLSQGVGTMASGSYGCLEMALICDEVIGMAMRAVAGITVDSESLALDVIREIGPRGHFLDHPHTAEFFRREMYLPRLFDRQTVPLWSDAGAKRIDEVASDRVRAILAEHRPEPVGDSATQALAEILNEATAELTQHRDGVV